jgi:hypothetical protein
VGDEVDLAVELSGSGVPVWTVTDTAVVGVSGGSAGARVEARRPGSAEIVATLAGGASDRVSLTVDPRPGGYSTDAIDYFAEIAFGSEYGSSDPVVRRWRDRPRVRVNGSPTAQDRVILEGVMSEINALAPVAMVLTDSVPSVELHFAHPSTFADLLPSYVPGNVGFFSVWWDESQYIYRAVVLVSTELDQNARDHIIREEITQILGLMRDSFRYPESIFYQSWSLVSRYAAVDEDLIEMLYRAELPVGTPPDEAVRVLRKLTRVAPSAPAALLPASPPSPGARTRPGWATGSGGR